MGKGKSVKSKKRSYLNAFLKFLLIFLLLFLMIIVLTFSTYLYRAEGNFSQALKTFVKDVVGDQEPIFVLILGVSEDISSELTDTIMLLGYNPDTSKAFVLSIPRDTYIGTNEKKAGGMDKINALYQKNPQKTVQAVESLTGIKVNYYVTIKTGVLVDIVDSIGGVEYDVPINMNYDDPTQNLHIHLKSGLQRLDGKKAEHLVRFRHNNNGTTYSKAYGDNDEGRMRTQREFLKVVAEQVIRTKNVDQIKQVISAVFDNLDTNISLNKMVGYVPYAVDFNINELEMEQLPGVPAKINDLWFYKVDSKKTKNLVDGYIEILGLTEEERAQALIPTNNK